MPSIILEIPTSVPVLDSRFVDHDESLVQEHLTYYCSKFEPLPAITIRARSDAAYVIRGHKYLVAARSLGRERMRAVIDSSSDPHAVERLTARADIRRLDLTEIEKEEARDPVPLAWHVVFFIRPLSSAERADFDQAIVRLLGGPVVIAYDSSGVRAEFRVPTPVFDRDWATGFLAALSAFHREGVPIASYQGRSFPK